MRLGTTEIILIVVLALVLFGGGKGTLELVEDEDIGIFHEHFQQAETALFTAGELADRGVLHFRIEEKALAHR